MNLLAKVIHEISVDQENRSLAELTQPEQTALTALKTLLNRPPQELAALLAAGQQVNDWALGRPSITSDQT